VPRVPFVVAEVEECVVHRCLCCRRSVLEAENFSQRAENFLTKMKMAVAADVHNVFVTMKIRGHHPLFQCVVVVVI